MTSNAKLVGLGAYPPGGCACGETPTKTSYAVLGIVAAGVAAFTWVMLFTGQRTRSTR